MINGLNVSIFDLLRFAKSLENEAIELKEKLGLQLDEEDYKRKWQVNIINKTPKCKDAWELEKI